MIDENCTYAKMIFVMALWVVGNAMNFNVNLNVRLVHLWTQIGPAKAEQMTAGDNCDVKGSWFAFKTTTYNSKN